LSGRRETAGRRGQRAPPSRNRPTRQMPSLAAPPPMGLDLTNVVSSFLDRHLVIPLLDFVLTHPNMEGQYARADVLAAKLEVLSHTNMLDYALEVHAELHGDDVPPPAEILERREKVLVLLQALQEAAGPVQRVLDDGNLYAELRGSGKFTMEHLSEAYGVDADVLDAVYDYGKFQFDIGSYEDASVLMTVYRQLMAGSNPEREFYALWGKFACSILVGDWDVALEDIQDLKDAIDSNGRVVTLNPLQQLQHRTWLIHWSLFVYFNHADGRNGITDLLFQDKYLNAIQTNCPHVLRYLTAAVITNKRRRNVVKDLVTVIQQETYNYSDPITEFVQCLYVNFDFEGAQGMLQKCEDTLRRDYFLVGTLDDFLEDARMTIFETYCRIHQVIDIAMLASKLNMERGEAEKWVVNLIRNARMDAKIDSQANQVIMGVTVPSVYDQVVESTKSLLIRGNVLQQNISVGIGAGGGGGDRGGGSGYRGGSDRGRGRGRR
jgi:translation initiation factor 3 subunit E